MVLKPLNDVQIPKWVMETLFMAKNQKLKNSSFAWSFVSKVLLGDLKHVFSGTFGPRGFADNIIFSIEFVKFSSIFEKKATL